MIDRIRNQSLPFVLLLAVGGAVIAYVGWKLTFGAAREDASFVYYDLVRTDLPIVITERGNLESQQETTIRCQVENYSQSRNGQSGTQIIFIVPNGSPVKKGDLLVELDSAGIREMLDQQEITYERTNAEFIQAEAKYKNQIKQNETLKANAELDVELARLELEMYQDEENGTHKLKVDEIQRAIDQINTDILEAQADLEIRRKERDGVNALFALGYKGESDLDSAQLAYLRAEGSLAGAVARLETERAKLSKLNAYEEQMERMKLDGAKSNAERALAQVIVDNVSELTQAEAAMKTAERALEKEGERLAKLRTQLEFCQIEAPHDGMVVYARDRDYTIEEGAFVRERQRILDIPNLSFMEVKTYVHESVLDQVEVGQDVTVRVDAFADRVYEGKVESVAVVPAYRGRSSSDVKTYETVVKIDGQVDQLKPGMTAVVDINVDRLNDILAVPVQAIVQRKSESWCYVSNRGQIETRPLKLGRTNDKFVQINDGLFEGDRVILNPMAILDSESESESAPGSDEDSGPESESTESEDSRNVAMRDMAQP